MISTMFLQVLHVLFGVCVSTQMHNLPVLEMGGPFPVMVPLPELRNHISGTAFTVRFFSFLARVLRRPNIWCIILHFFLQRNHLGEPSERNCAEQFFVKELWHCWVKTHLTPRPSWATSCWWLMPELGCAFWRNFGGISTECGKRHRPKQNVTGTGTGMCYNTILDIPVHSGWYLSTMFLQVENARNYSK